MLQKTPTSDELAGAFCRRIMAEGYSASRASVIFDFQIHKSLVQELVGYFAKRNRPDKGTGLLVFKVGEQIVQNTVAREHNLVCIRPHYLAYMP